jgi:hypothetical protein
MKFDNVYNLEAFTLSSSDDFTFNRDTLITNAPYNFNNPSTSDRPGLSSG